jgi:low temperature requirement protein LtrA
MPWMSDYYALIITISFGSCMFGCQFSLNSGVQNHNIKTLLFLLIHCGMRFVNTRCQSRATQATIHSAMWEDQEETTTQIEQSNTAQLGQGQPEFNRQ